MMRHLPVLLTAALMLPLAGLAQDHDQISGQASYLDRMALPDDALLLVEVLDAAGQPLRALRLPTQGAQVPLPFSVVWPEQDGETLRAGIIIDGALVWLGEPVAVSDAPMEVTLDRYQPIGFSATFRCGDQIVQTGFADDALVLDTGAQRVILQEVATASGARYDAPDDPGTYVWRRGDLAQIVVDDRALPDCRISLPPVSAAYVARGNEPFWTVTLDAGAMTLSRLGLDDMVLPVAEAGLQPDGAVFVTAANGASLERERKICQDSMSGMPYPETVHLTLGPDVLTGCGGDSRDLLTGRTWAVTQIADAPVPDDAQVTLRFDTGGRVAGTGGCNNWFAGYDLTGEGLRLTQIGATMMACDPGLMAQERAFQAALAQVTGFGIAPNGALLLQAAETAVIRAEAAN